MPVEVHTPAELDLAVVYYQARGSCYSDATIRTAVEHMAALIDAAREQRAVMTANLAAEAAARQS